jgi:dihydrofolate reductase
LHPVAGRTLVAELSFAAEDALPVLAGWRDLSATAPRQATFAAGIGGDLVTVGFVRVGDLAAGRRLLPALRALGRPVAEQVTEPSYLELQTRDDTVRGHAFRRYWKGHYFRALGDEVIAALLARDGGLAPDVNLQTYGGAIADSHGRGGLPGRVHGRRQRRRRAAVRLVRRRRCRLELPGLRRRVPDHPGVGRLHARPPTDWEYADTAPFTFLDGVEKAITAAKEFAGDRVVDVAAGQIGGQALRLGLIDQVVVNQVPVVFGSGRPFFATGGLAEPLRLENPTTIVSGDRVTHLVYDISH